MSIQGAAVQTSSVALAASVLALGVGMVGAALAWMPSRGEADGDPSRGALIYAETCAGCHGADRQGQAGWQRDPASRSMIPPPLDATGHVWQHADAELLGFIARGQKVRGNKS